MVEHLKEEIFIDIKEQDILEQVEFYSQNDGVAFAVRLVVKNNYLNEPQYYLKVYDASDMEHQIISLGPIITSNLHISDLFNDNRSHIVVTRGYSGNSRLQSFTWDRNFEKFLNAEVSHGISFTNTNKAVFYAQIVVEHNTFGIEIRTESGEKVQYIDTEPSTYGLPIPLWITARDLNNDGYMDIVVHRGGTQNFVHDLFIWEVDLHKFVKVNYIGFETLSLFEVRDKYLINILRSHDYHIRQTLIWKGNNLIKISQEKS